MNTSIVVSMYNKKESTLEIIDKMFFPSLIRNASKDKELIILDDLSPMKVETENLIKKYIHKLKSKFGRVVFLRNEKNLGFAGSYNRAMSLARGENLIVTNDDIYLPKGSIDNFISILNRNKNIGVVGPITGWRGSSTYQYCKHGAELKAYSKREFEKIELFAVKVKNLLKNRPLKKVEYIAGFCFATRKSIINKIGGFDDRFLYGHLEDTDLIIRIGREKDIMVAPSLYIHHGGIDGASASINQHPMKYLKFRIINIYKFIKKYSLWRYLKMATYMLPRFYGHGTVSDLIKEEQNDLIHPINP